MKKKLILLIILGCLVTVPILSVAYKVSLAFYQFKGAMCTYVVPKEISSVKFELPTRVEALSKPDKSFERNVSGVREWLLHPEGAPDAVSVIEKAYGSWCSLEKDYPTDKDILDAVLARNLPSYLTHGSLSMQYPIGYYVFPLFPPAIDYQKEYALFAARSMMPGGSLTIMTTEGDELFFYVLWDPSAAEIIYGDMKSGTLMKSILFLEPLSMEQIKKLCYGIEASVNQPLDRTSQAQSGQG